MTLNDLNTALKSFDGRFAKFMPFVFQAECVFREGQIIVEEEDGDDGGATFAGLDSASHPSLKFSTMSPQDVCQVYFSEWQANKVSQYLIPFGECFQDFAINAGIGRAIKTLQISGPDATAFNKERRAFYTQLATQKPVLAKFLRGWLNRVDNLEKFLGLQG